MDFPKPITSVEWLANNLENDDLVLLDASVPKPMTKAEDNPLAGIQIPGSRFFGIDNVFSDHTVDLPHTMLSAENFQKEARKLGINTTSKIVVYDNLGVYSSPRAWWMLRSMGHEEASVLDGGLPEWVRQNLATETKAKTTWKEGDFTAHPKPYFFKNSAEVSKAIDDPTSRILDARSKGRFAGSEPEPRAGLRSGHIPGSLNLPFSAVIDGNKLLPAEGLKKQFERLGISDQELIFSCGSGLTACVISLAANIAGFEKLSVYDGSWSEWGRPGDLPVATGE